MLKLYQPFYMLNVNF